MYAFRRAYLQYLYIISKSLVILSGIEVYVYAMPDRSMWQRLILPQNVISIKKFSLQKYMYTPTPTPHLIKNVTCEVNLACERTAASA